MKVTIEINPEDVERIKILLANQAHLRLGASKITADPKDVKQYEVEAEFCRSVHNAICDMQNWELHQARQKVAV